MKEILFFSNNKNKIIEISNFFKNSSIKILSLNDFKKIYSPKETGSTFEENAKIKSLYGYKNFKIICFADDSGICINALKGKPGINSKNFLHSTKNERDILKKIISIAKLKNNYDAEFHSKICLTINKNKNVFFEGIVKGKIAKKITGNEGFGYDPIFIPMGKKVTFAEMNLDEKNTISHRSIAIQKLKNYITKIF